MNAAHHHQLISHTQRQSRKLSPPAAQRPYGQYEEPSPPYTTASSNYTTNDPLEPSPAKRPRLSGPDNSEASSETATRAMAKTGAASAKPSTSGSVASSASRPEPRRGSAEGAGEGKAPIPAGAAGTKSRRVRTGCLTCRERHLKCDEGLPDCVNCRKSNRECKRGVRLNFIDTQCKDPPFIPPTLEWSVQFQDESRLIASEYRGGLGRYARLDPKHITPPRETELDAAFQGQQKSSANADHQGGQGLHHHHPGLATQAQSEQQGLDAGRMRELQSRTENDGLVARGPAHANFSTQTSGSYTLTNLRDQFTLKGEQGPRSHAHQRSIPSITTSMVPQVTNAPSTFRPALGPRQPTGKHDGLVTPPNEKATGEREYLGSDEEIYFMQVFVSEVAIWMDSFDHEKHFSRVIPYLALKSPMLLNAFLACGVKHLTLVEAYSDEKALYYYDTATTQLLRSLQNPDRNMAECATTAVVLNVYEIMSESPGQRMSHIAGARALIRECGWNARSKGIGAACFWLNIGMEVLSCLAFNWQTAWDPDQWGIDMDFTGWGSGESAGPDAGDAGERKALDSLGGGGEEEMWVHRMFYIMAKIGNFKANVPRFQEPSPHDEEARKQNRFAEWKRFKNMCDAWNLKCPRPMRPFGYSHERSSNSLFPNIWLIKRAAVVGRLFYHTAMCLLAQINPTNPRDSPENREAQIHHARQVCGIVAHTKDRGVSSVAIRSLAIASAVLSDRAEQTEVLAILEKIGRETGWRLEKVFIELKKTWGWETAPPSLVPMGSMPAVNTQAGPSGPPQFFPPAQSLPVMAASTTTALVAPTPTRAKINPLLAQADFSLPNHPYQNWYEPPNRSNTFNSHGFWMS